MDHTILKIWWLINCEHIWRKKIEKLWLSSERKIQGWICFLSIINQCKVISMRLIIWLKRLKCIDLKRSKQRISLWKLAKFKRHRTPLMRWRKELRLSMSNFKILKIQWWALLRLRWKSIWHLLIILRLLVWTSIWHLLWNNYTIKLML